MSDTAESSASADGKIVCHIDNARVHSIQQHLRNHPEWTIERYKSEFPDAPLLSDKAKAIIAKNAKEQREKAASSVDADAGAVSNIQKAHLHDLFDLGNVPAAMSALGRPISIDVLGGHTDEDLIYLPEIDRDYVFNIDLLKHVALAFQLNKPAYLWGYHGTGKTTIFEQVAARTRRPFSRVQHTAFTEEAHIVGQYVVRNGATEFQLGPLPMAMLQGHVYCADEYDAGLPQVTLVYQAVLEGKPLVIKDAPPEFRVIRPHPNFRICATGNTNGVGDETGLYQGTNIQNAANFSRFPITVEVKYMDPRIEKSVLVGKTGIDDDAAQKIVKFANEIRESFADGKIGMTISPRELINAAFLGLAYGAKWSLGLELAFANRCSRVDKKVVMEYAQRIFGSAA